MSKFVLSAKVKRVVIDTVSLHVEADNETDAHIKAYRVLDTFPDPHDEVGVGYCYIEHRENGPADVIEITEEEDRGIA